MKAEAIAKALGGRKAGSGWMTRCPAHDDHEPSLSIREGLGGKTLVHCHAGCDQERVIAALRARGLWPENSRRSLLRRARRTPVEPKPDREDGRQSKGGLTIWCSANPARGTLVET